MEGFKHVSIVTNVTPGIISDESEVRPGLLSDQAREIFILVNHVILSTVVALFGIGANVINVCVFVRQGLAGSSTSVSLFAMSISDLVSLVTLLWLNVCLNPYIGQLDSPLVFIEVQYLTAGWPHACSARITAWITAYITAERCLSIVLPLKVKQIVTPRRSAVILSVIYVFNVLTLLPEYATAYFAWSFNPGRNHTALGLAFRNFRPATEGLVFTLHASLAISAFIAVVIFTSILVLRLKKSSSWRKSTTFDQRQSESSSARDRRTMIMVILVAIILIISYTPTVIISILSSAVSEFSVVGRQSNIFHSAWSFGFLSHSVNSSINIFTYHKMSSKYRKTFNQMFASCRIGPSAARDDMVPQSIDPPGDV